VEIGAAAGLPSGTVHPILARLETVGWLTSRWEEIDPRAEGRPARRYYHLTPDGAELARAALAYQASAGPVWLRPLGEESWPPWGPGDRPGGPAHLVGELGRPVGLHLSEKRWPIPTKGRRPALLIGRCRQ
jgi:hypothetical protein